VSESPVEWLAKRLSYEKTGDNKRLSPHAPSVQLRIVSPAFLALYFGFSRNGLWLYLCQLILSIVYFPHIFTFLM
jgi:hypothetical protein